MLTPQNRLLALRFPSLRISEAYLPYGHSGVAGVVAALMSSLASSYAHSISTIHSFNASNGRTPVGTLVINSGSLYGVTAAGGANDFGTVFKIPLGLAGLPVSVTTLATFTGGANGREPLGGVTIDAAGNLYGTTNFGGVTSIFDTSAGKGTVYKIPGGTSLSPGSVITLAKFTDIGGQNSNARVTLDAQGNIFGTTMFGELGNAGVVFTIPDGTTLAPGPISALLTYNSGSDPNRLHGELLMDSAGDFYTTSEFGGTGQGTVHKVLRNPIIDVQAGTITRFITLTTFDIFGSHPVTGLTADAQGNLYGTTSRGGPGDVGSVFKIPGGMTATPSPLVTLATFPRVFSFFSFPNGAYPSNLLIDDAGNIFGTTNSGGVGNFGTVFKIPGGATATPQPLITLVSFSSNNGAYPSGGLVADMGGNLYGTTSSGGANNHGTVFRIEGAGFMVDNNYSSWIAGYPEVGTLTGLMDDPDGDGILNGIEAWFGTQPDEISGGLTIVATNATNATFTHPKNANPPVDLSISYEWSSNLVDWYACDGLEGPFTGETLSVSSTTANTTTTITATPSGPMKRLFLRAGVRQSL